MKPKFALCLAGLCGVFTASVFAQNAREPSAPTVAAAPGAKSSASLADTTGALTLAQAQKIIAGAKQYVAHPQPTVPGRTISEPQVKTPDFQMAEAPPTPRAETKPPAPSAGLVWVPGHYMPVEGKWRWVNGEWAVPALPISVWIVARYDAKEKKWSPGYWQPDASSATTVAPADPAAKPGETPAPRAGY